MTIESPASVNTFIIAHSVFAALFFNTLTMFQDCTLLSAGSRVKNSVKILKGVRRQPFLKVSGITLASYADVLRGGTRDKPKERLRGRLV